MAQTKRKLTEAQKAKRKEYTRQRDIVRKRILRAQAKGEMLNAEIPPKLSEIKSGRQLAKELQQVEKFIASPYSTSQGRAAMKEKRMEGYRKAGYTNVTESNEQKFQKFMNHMIKKYTMDTPEGKKLLHDSDTIASFFDEMVEEDKVHDKTRLSDLVRMFNKWVG